VIDYDRLIILDKGQVSVHARNSTYLTIISFQIVEFDNPWNLINKEGGFFRNMCFKSGSFSELEAAAKGKPEL